MKIALLTLGCKVNQSEIASIEAGLMRSGKKNKNITIVGLDEKPDICVINTCSVTAKSDYQSRQLIRKAAQTGAKLIVTGCYSELNFLETGNMKGVEQVVANSEKANIIKMITGDSSSSIESNEGLIKKSGRSRYFLKIQDGCSYSCSYCIVWKARGRSKSIEPETVIGQIRQAHKIGYKEVVLTGIHLGLYHSGIGLSALVERILSETDIGRVRLSSLEVNEIDDKIIELMKTGRVCRHAHIPLQSGDDHVLSLMKRRYKTASFIDKVNKMVSEIPDIAIGTDIIIGFPGEGETEFNNTRALLERISFAYMHVFTYSERPGTEALGFPNKVLKEEKKKRSLIIREMAGLKKRSFIDSLTGKGFEVVIEKGKEKDPKGDFFDFFVGKPGITGITDNYVKVFIPIENTGDPEVFPAGSSVNIRLLDRKKDMAIGELVVNA